MFKKCKESVCSTNSIYVATNPKKVSVLHHSRSESAAESQCPNQGTNQWLKNGGVLPLVAVDPTTKKLSPLQPLKQPTSAVRSHAVPKQMKEQLARQTTSNPNRTKSAPRTQAVLKSSNSSYLVEKYDKDEQLKQTQEQLVFDKENYLSIISHFNEQDLVDHYNPAEYCERKCAQSSPHVTRRPSQATVAPEIVSYSEEAKAEILLSIREELKSWRNDDEAKRN